MGALDRLIESELGVKVDPVLDPVVSAIGTSSTGFLKNSPDRLGFLLANLGSYPIFIRPGELATTTNGLRLDANGGSAFFWWREDLQIVGWNWEAIASGGSTAIFTLDLIADIGGGQ